MNLKHLLAVVLFAAAGIIGTLIYSHHNTAQAAKPSPEISIKSPAIAGVYQGDADEMYASWTKAQAQLDISQRYISDYVALMNAKVKKNGLKEGTYIAFEATLPCVPQSDGTQRCTNVAKIVTAEEAAAARLAQDQKAKK